MEIVLKIQGNIYILMRQCGYYFERPARNAPATTSKMLAGAGGQDKEELAFCRIIGASKSGYPRFHAYIKINNVSQETIINLHLDQKRPVYKGVPAHSAEYDSEAVKKEIVRIKQTLGL